MIAVVSIVLAGCVKAAALPDKPNRHVVDMTGTLQNHDVEELDKRLDIISSIILASISFASALVAIILARIALLFAENEEKREFREIS